MKEIRTEIRIEAGAEKVWKILTDFDRFPEWNPFMRYLKGAPTEGTQIEVKLVPPGSKGVIFKPKVLRFEKKQEFRWLGHTGLPGLFDGEYIMELAENPDGSTQFVQREKFTGVLVPFLSSSLDGSTKTGFELMNQKLRQLCEG